MDDAEFLRGIGDRIRHYRKRRGISQETLAHNASINRGHMSDLECGRRNVSVMSLRAIARALNVKLFQLMPDWKMPTGR